MLISHEQMREINDVQIDILKAVSDVCKALKIEFFMVHGSLLGTIKNHKFIPDDDDIDIALRRNDYELFVKEAPKLLDKHFFVQTCLTDVGYPLEFGKVRDSRTTYVIENSRKLKINHGIYIDIFPIDNCYGGGLISKFYNLKYKLLNMRIASTFDLKGESVVKKTVRLFSKIFNPSYARAVLEREKMLKRCPATGYVRMSGGKTTEQNMPIEWFSKAVPGVFEGVEVFVPEEYDKYLSLIYGEYASRTLVENKVCDEHNIEVNACIIDVNKPYKDYAVGNWEK